MNQQDVDTWFSDVFSSLNAAGFIPTVNSKPQVSVGLVDTINQQAVSLVDQIFELPSVGSNLAENIPTEGLVNGLQMTDFERPKR